MCAFVWVCMLARKKNENPWSEWLETWHSSSPRYWVEVNWFSIYFGFKRSMVSVTVLGYGGADLHLHRVHIFVESVLTFDSVMQEKRAKVSNQINPILGYTATIFKTWRIYLPLSFERLSRFVRWRWWWSAASVAGDFGDRYSYSRRGCLVSRYQLIPSHFIVAGRSHNAPSDEHECSLSRLCSSSSRRVASQLNPSSIRHSASVTATASGGPSYGARGWSTAPFLPKLPRFFLVVNSSYT